MEHRRNKSRVPIHVKTTKCHAPQGALLSTEKQYSFHLEIPPQESGNKLLLSEHGLYIFIMEPEVRGSVLLR